MAFSASGAVQHVHKSVQHLQYTLSHVGWSRVGNLFKIQLGKEAFRKGNSYGLLLFYILKKKSKPITIL